MTVCSYHVTYAFQSESILYGWLNVKELLARSSRDIWNLSDRNGTWTHNHLVRKRTEPEFLVTDKTTSVSTKNYTDTCKKAYESLINPQFYTGSMRIWVLFGYLSSPGQPKKVYQIQKTLRSYKLFEILRLVILQKYLNQKHFP